MPMPAIMMNAAIEAMVMLRRRRRLARLTTAFRASPLSPVPGTLADPLTAAARPTVARPVVGPPGMCAGERPGRAWSAPGLEGAPGMRARPEIGPPGLLASLSTRPTVRASIAPRDPLDASAPV